MARAPRQHQHQSAGRETRRAGRAIRDWCAPSLTRTGCCPGGGEDAEPRGMAGRREAGSMARWEPVHHSERLAGAPGVRPRVRPSSAMSAPPHLAARWVPGAVAPPGSAMSPLAGGGGAPPVANTDSAAMAGQPPPPPGCPRAAPGGGPAQLSIAAHGSDMGPIRRDPARRRWCRTCPLRRRQPATKAPRPGPGRQGESRRASAVAALAEPPLHNCMSPAPRDSCACPGRGTALRDPALPASLPEWSVARRSPHAPRPQRTAPQRRARTSLWAWPAPPRSSRRAAIVRALHCSTETPPRASRGRRASRRKPASLAPMLPRPPASP